MWITSWTKCPGCGRDWSLRLAAGMAERAFGGGRWRSKVRLFWPVSWPSIESDPWVCGCGATLHMARRRLRPGDVLVAGVLAGFVMAIGALTDLWYGYPRLFWFAGIVLIVVVLAFRGVGKYEVQLRGRSSR
jgi:hypothetical protein